MGFGLSYGLLIWLLLPEMVVALDDDFAYLRSAVETWRRARPWTDDWLNPWAVSSSVAVALLYSLTGSFSFAVHGFLASVAGLGAGFTFHHLARRGIPTVTAGITTLVAWTLPAVLFMSLMFTSVAVYMACLWVCIHCHARRWWTGFFIAWAIAIAGRQSAIVWLALPGLALVQEWWRSGRRLPTAAVSRLALWLVAALGFVALLKSGMNPTRGQGIMLRLLQQTAGWRTAVVPLGLGLLALAAGVGITGLATLASGTAAVRPGWQRLLWAFVLCMAGMVAAQWAHQQLSWTHWCYDRQSPHGYLMLMAIPVSIGLGLRPLRLHADYLITGLLSLGLLCLYGGTFDYYYTDLVFWGMAAALCASPTPAVPAAATWSHTLPRIAFTVLMACALGQLLLSARQKLQQDHAVAQIRLQEQALRSGTLQPHQISSTPFGYAGWHWETPWARMDADHSTDLAAFLRCTDRWDGTRGTGIVCDYPRSLRSSALLRTWLPARNSKELLRQPDATVLGQTTQNVLWFFPTTFTLKRVGGDSRPENMPILTDEPPSNRFPLSDAEWNHHLRPPGDLTLSAP